MPSAPSGTSSVITEPAPVYASSPTVTGATSEVWTPVRTSPADHRAVLAAAVVVGGDRAGADVRARADVGVADVGEVRDLGARADVGVLDLHERAGLGALVQRGARAGCG